MNEHDPVKAALARFRETRPPACVRDSNRAAVRRALRPLDAAPWWRQSVALPLPVVLATAAALLISVSIHLVPSQKKEAPREPNLVVEASSGIDDAATTLVATTDPHVEHVVTHRYLSGVGVIDRDVVYLVKE